MTLSELIAALEAANPDTIVPVGFRNAHSYRGIYSELAFEPFENVKVSEMLQCARTSLGASFTGYKGGSFRMGEYAQVHLAYPGDVGEEIGPVLLSYMLGRPVMPRERP
jgi:hypothetical protein